MHDAFNFIHTTELGGSLNPGSTLLDVSNGLSLELGPILPEYSTANSTARAAKIEDTMAIMERLRAGGGLAIVFSFEPSLVFDGAEAVTGPLVALSVSLRPAAIPSLGCSVSPRDVIPKSL